MKKFIIPLALILLLASCVTKKKYLELQTANEATTKECHKKLDNCEDELAKKQTELESQQSKVRSLEEQLEYMKATNTNLLARMADLSVLSQSESENIKKSLEAINQQTGYIKDLTTAVRQKDSLNLALVMNLKRSLENVSDSDVNIEVKKGVVYISISDKMLFKSGSYKINPKAEEVLGKIAQVVNDHNELEILVEGHTDNVPIQTDCMDDNWDLSVMRSTAVVRLLQTKYNVAPGRMTAGGRSEFVPKESNETANGRGTNRRTEIIILPKLDQFFKLLEPGK